MDKLNMSYISKVSRDVLIEILNGKFTDPENELDWKSLSNRVDIPIDMLEKFEHLLDWDILWSNKKLCDETALLYEGDIIASRLRRYNIFDRNKVFWDNWFDEENKIYYARKDENAAYKSEDGVNWTPIDISNLNYMISDIKHRCINVGGFDLNGTLKLQHARGIVTPQKPMQIKVKYFDPICELAKIENGDWLDVRSRDELFIPGGTYKSVRLGFAMELPEGYEAHLATRSSAFKKYGIISTTGVSVIDNSYKGDNDEWHLPVYAMRDCQIRKGDRIGQFRIMENMPKIEFDVVDTLGNVDRNGFGSTGVK